MVWTAREALEARDLRAAIQAVRSGLLNVVNATLGRFRKPRFVCPCCNTQSYALIHLGNRLRPAWHSMCPACGSRSRHRALTLILDRLVGPDTSTVLHFAPEPLLGDVIRRDLPAVDYRTTDLLMGEVDYPGEDIQKMSLPAESFDVILCNHVLEHVPDDDAGFAEISRLLRPGGKAIITVPGDWRREQTIYFDDLTLNGHYRDYGQDLDGRLRQRFERVDVVPFSTIDQQTGGLSYGVRDNDRVFVCYAAS